MTPKKRREGLIWKKSTRPTIMLGNSLPQAPVYITRHSAVLTERSKMSQENDFLSSQRETGRKSENTWGLSLLPRDIFSPDIY